MNLCNALTGPPRPATLHLPSPSVLSRRRPWRGGQTGENESGAPGALMSHSASSAPISLRASELGGNKTPKTPLIISWWAQKLGTKPPVGPTHLAPDGPIKPAERMWIDGLLQYRHSTCLAEQLAGKLPTDLSRSPSGLLEVSSPRG